MPRPLGWLRARMGVRAVSALSAAVVVALALLVAGAALLLLVQQSLRASVQAEAEQQAGLIATRLDQNWQGEANENAREALSALTRESDDLAQVVVEYGDTPQRTLEAGTDPLGGYRDGTPMSDIRPDDGETVVRTDVPVRKVDGSVVDTVLVAIAGQSAGNDVVVLYAAPLTVVDHTTGTLLFYLLCGVPLLIVVAGLTTYLFSGRALRPVEAIRAQVAEMTEKDLGQRVPVPRARDEVGRLAETMNAMIARLQDAQGVQRRFVADASHELRSPLATIATGLELMQSGTVDRSTITALRGETTRLNKLVEALILLARADERGLQPRREEVDLDEVAEGERGRPADGKVVAEVRTVPVRVVGDRGQLARVVRNLVDNARRHARSRVLVTVRQDADAAVLEVSDDGPGVPPADRARVFERFVRLDDARARADGGSGLGLAIVAEVVAAHGGRVEVTDAPGGGALFRVRLPVAAAPEPQPDEPPAPAAASAGPAATTRPAPATRPVTAGPPSAATPGPAAPGAPAPSPAPTGKPVPAAAPPATAGAGGKSGPAAGPAGAGTPRPAADPGSPGEAGTPVSSQASDRAGAPAAEDRPADPADPAPGSAPAAGDREPGRDEPARPTRPGAEAAPDGGTRSGGGRAAERPSRGPDRVRRPRPVIPTRPLPLPRPASPRAEAPQGTPPPGTPPQGTPPQGAPPQGTPSPGTPPRGVPSRPDPAGAAPPAPRPGGTRSVTRWSAPPWSGSPRPASPWFASPRPGNGRPATETGSPRPANAERRSPGPGSGSDRPAPENGRASGAQAAGHPGPAPRPRGGGQRPVRDDEARRDPVTAPYGVPAVPPAEPGPDDEHRPDDERRTSPVPRPQPGSAIR
ncbi:ATP-binding protein [Pseudonocardia sichuanensis]